MQLKTDTLARRPLANSCDSPAMHEVETGRAPASSAGQKVDLVRLSRGQLSHLHLELYTYACKTGTLPVSIGTYVVTHALCYVYGGR